MQVLLYCEFLLPVFQCVERVIPTELIMNEKVQHWAKRAKIYDICVAMVRYTFVQSCHQGPVVRLQLWTTDAAGKAGKDKTRKFLQEINRESLVIWGDDDVEWQPCRITDPTRRDTVMDLEEAMRAWPLFGIHHPWCKDHKPETEEFRKDNRGRSIRRITDYTAGQSCLQCHFYQPIPDKLVVTTFLDQFQPTAHEEGVKKFVQSFEESTSMARSVWQPEIGAMPINACKDIGYLTKAASILEITFVNSRAFVAALKQKITHITQNIVFICMISFVEKAAEHKNKHLGRAARQQ